MSIENLNTVTVLGSRAAETPDKRVALILDTREVGPLAFEVNQQAVAAIRESLAAIEQLLLAQTGRA